MAEAPGCPLVPLSWGEVIDKVTILEIKLARIGAAGARANVARELSCLSAIAEPVLADLRVSPLAAQLRAVNERLWEIEDAIRARDSAGDFGERFVALARSVYQTNDVRARLKRELNLLLDSDLIEEKSYAASTPAESAG